MSVALLQRGPDAHPEADRCKQISLDEPGAAKGRRAVGLMASGLLLVLVAVRLLVTPDSQRHRVPDPVVPDSAATSPASSADRVTVLHSGFDPHESSTWHTHDGVHAIAILSGTLTVYGEDCRPVHYGPGASWVGGQGLHLTRNEGDEPVVMTETVVVAAGQPLHSFVIPSAPPAGCEI